MAFLDSSGDIILDAVLTDTGRLRLAQGDGSFKISKFALGDDEINYGNYNKNHASGSAYFDLEILQTPILEAFTNNSSQIKSRLMTMSRTNILYMPVLKLNLIDTTAPVTANPAVMAGTSHFFKRTIDSTDVTAEETSPVANRFFISTDADTHAYVYKRRNSSGVHTDVQKITGLLQGYQGQEGDVVNYSNHLIRIDQGIDSNQIAPTVGMDTDLRETAYIVEMDYRLGRVKQASTSTSNAVAAANFIDDDNIATYYLTGDNYVDPYDAGVPSNNTATLQVNNSDGTDIQVFAGPRGSTLHFRIEASAELQSSTYLFEQLGNTEDSDTSNNMFGFGTNDTSLTTGSKNTYYIDTTIRVIGANTGFRLDIPVRFIKIQ